MKTLEDKMAQLSRKRQREIDERALGLITEESSRRWKAGKPRERVGER